jgi:transposase
MTGRDNRIEVVSVVQRHKQRSWAQKARIVAEAEAPGSSFGSVASRYALQTAQIYTWRKLLRERASCIVPTKLASVHLVGDSHGARDSGQAPLTPHEPSGVVEVRIGDTITVLISGAVPVETLATVLRTLKAGSA